ncbi:arylsulfatase [Coraliomargarita sp. SDUM461004]|uniref:Arylsulfatase n=1 Tax=Thalassobacterium sedimentorum TaxID=3041258 RepID=A0ABU1AM75_9BACT|nr:arylsulfatase [Coraliomargarita sp. SDUM461004]MDQ8195886.1 arylsulfatase [Coraliomargarita sp. SDUM461004]
MPQRLHRPLRALIALALALSLGNATATAASEQPDIIYILADDLGYSDLGCYGSEINTPNLDRLAQEGLRFTQFYNASKCEPSRANIMSGHYWPVTGLGVQRGATLGEVMRPAGYATFALGKWHLNGSPIDRGFDRFFGHLSGASAFFPPIDQSFRLDKTPFKPQTKDFYVTDAVTDYAIDFIKESKAAHPDKPYFMYLAYNAPHNPLQAPREDIERYRGTYKAGWDAIRAQRFARMQALGIMGDEVKLSAHPSNLPEWESLSPAQKELEDLRMAVYAAMVDRLDHNIGRLLQNLKEAGLDKNLLVIFMSDNGGSPYARTDENMLAQDKLPGDPGSNWEIGMGWANVSNTPLRLYKRNQHEGGISTPFIAWWPNQIARPNSIVTQPAHIIDLMPTFLELAGSTYAAAGKGKALPELPGKSLLPIFQGEVREPHDALYFQLYDHRAIRAGDWKLTAVDGKDWELYNIAKDRSETVDLSSSHPELVQKLSINWENWWLNAKGKPYAEFKNPTPAEHLRDDRSGGTPYVPTAMPDRLRDR